MGLASAERSNSFSGLVNRNFCIGSHCMPEKALATGDGGRFDMASMYKYLSMLLHLSEKVYPFIGCNTELWR